MAVYFLVMYLGGGAFGPLALGALSDHLAGGVSESARAAGLHQAMYAIPVPSVLRPRCCGGGEGGETGPGGWETRIKEGGGFEAAESVPELPIGQDVALQSLDLPHPVTLQDERAFRVCRFRHGGELRQPAMLLYKAAELHRRHLSGLQK